MPPQSRRPRTLADGTTPSPALRGAARAVLNRLKRRYPTIRTALDYETPWQLLVATVLSAQTTDETVNRITPVLFARYPEAADLAEAKPEDVEEVVFSTGFYRQKTVAIIALASDLVEHFDSVVPDDLDDLVALKGVGRKTAGVVLAEAFGIPAIAVDTHVKRTTSRLGLTEHADPVKIERDLMALFPMPEWAGVSMRLIQFGRDVCDARAPSCGECEMRKLCPWPDKHQ